ncbi:MAG TPA: hypothetical protein VI854_09625 [Acidimicrobiia bacterium]|nr:hypothetical protein [Acidimicrobiia bacterium]
MRVVRSRFGRWAAALPAVVGAAVLGALPATPVTAASNQPGTRFAKGVVAGTSSSRLTTLQFGPDGRLYAGQQNALIKAYSLERTGRARYAVTASETIDAIQTIPNHNDDGRENPGQYSRLMTGLVVTGTAGAPVIYATSSDPRIGGGPSGKERRLDTNSGIVSRLTRDPGADGGRARWRRLDLVRGLPRSEENHTGNGLALAPDGRTLYVAQGGMTNNGAPSTHFALTPEYALSAAILAIDLEAIGETTYDLPTLDDTDRPGPVDAGDPFGGNDGRNQARLVPDGPVRVHAAGFRNPYDVVVTAGGRMYTIDNGANVGWGAPPRREGPSGRCTNEASEGGPEQPDVLHLVDGPGYYGGHPNPTRGSRANLFNGQSPVEVAAPVECDHRVGAEAGARATFPASTNGLAEYGATSLGGALAGDLLAAGFDNRVYRLELSPDGRKVQASVLFDDVGTVPLDVTAQGTGSRFPGTVWVADFGDGNLTVFEPDDYPGGGGGDDDGGGGGQGTDGRRGPPATSGAGSPAGH